MSCNCGCHDDNPPATGWRRFVPLIVGAAVAGGLIAGAVLKDHNSGKSRVTPPPSAAASARP